MKHAKNVHSSHFKILTFGMKIYIPSGSPILETRMYHLTCQLREDFMDQKSTTMIVTTLAVKKN
jgi:hypothetical protein